MKSILINFLLLQVFYSTTNFTVKKIPQILQKSSIDTLLKLNYISTSVTRCTNDRCIKSKLDMIKSYKPSSYITIYKISKHKWLLYNAPILLVDPKYSVKKITILEGNITINDTRYENMKHAILYENI